MSFCRYCGITLKPSARFCHGCGKTVSGVSTTERPSARPTTSRATATSERRTAYEGTIYRCPSCSEILRSFDSECPSCGFEIRDRMSSDSVSAFSRKLNHAASERQKYEYIKSYIIPNTKEDVFEFMLLAYTNFDVGEYIRNLNRDDVSDAWLVKMEQCYQKARLLFHGEELAEIASMYNDVQNKIMDLKQKLREK